MFFRVIKNRQHWKFTSGVVSKTVTASCGGLSLGCFEQLLLLFIFNKTKKQCQNQNLNPQKVKESTVEPYLNFKNAFCANSHKAKGEHI